jgi:adenylate cyclase
MNNTHDMELAAQVLYQSVLVNASVYAIVGVWVTFLVSGSLTRSIAGMVPALKAVREGRFDTTVRVTSNDELGYAGDVINEMTAGLREREFIKEAFGKYVSREIRDEILAQRIPLDGELKEVTVLFADLRNFTPLVEKTSPKVVVQIINHYFEEMEKIITAHRGLILQFIGDEIEAVFGAPIALKNHPDMALQAAMAMHRQLDRVNRSLEQEGQPALSHGIGIHTGEVVAANIGSPTRLSYALVGDTVNVAARLQGLNKQFKTHLIASGTTMAQVTENYPLKALPATNIKGKSEAIALFGA